MIIHTVVMIFSCSKIESIVASGLAGEIMIGLAITAGHFINMLLGCGIS